MATNRVRAKWARDALGSFTLRVYNGRTPEELGAPHVDAGITAAGRDTIPEDCDARTMLGDLLSDLHHYCRAVGLSWESAIADANFHYRQERALGWDEEE